MDWSFVLVFFLTYLQQTRILQYCAPKLNTLVWGQRRSQNTLDARGQHRHTTFVRTSVQNAEATKGVWGHTLPGIVELPRSILRLLLGHTVASIESGALKPSLRYEPVRSVESLYYFRQTCIHWDQRSIKIPFWGCKYGYIVQLDSQYLYAFLEPDLWLILHQ